MEIEPSVTYFLCRSVCCSFLEFFTKIKRVLWEARASRRHIGAQSEAPLKFPSASRQSGTEGFTWGPSFVSSLCSKRRKHIELFNLYFDVHLFMQAATVIGWNKSCDLFLRITVAACKNKWRSNYKSKGSIAFPIILPRIFNIQVALLIGSYFL